MLSHGCADRCVCVDAFTWSACALHCLVRSQSIQEVYFVLPCEEEVLRPSKFALPYEQKVLGSSKR